jgi:hypothetical protein
MNTKKDNLNRPDSESYLQSTLIGGLFSPNALNGVFYKSEPLYFIKQDHQIFQSDFYSVHDSKQFRRRRLLYGVHLQRFQLNFFF